MPKPQGAGQRYMPGLDGLRAIAVLAVMAFHEQFGWAPGGLLGVAVFFTLSGYQTPRSGYPASTTTSAPAG